jgi:hypothetical protein
MKTNELVKLIRQLVKEEVSAEVSKAMGKVLVEMVREIKSPTLNQQQIVENKKPTLSPIKTNNPKLNSVLAETAQNYTPLKKTSDSAVSMASLLEEGFDKIGQNESAGVSPADDGTKIGFLKSIITETAHAPSVLDNGGEAVPDILKGVFKKDFRAVMKAIDEKKKNGSSGMINMNNIISG